MPRLPPWRTWIVLGARLVIDPRAVVQVLEDLSHDLHRWDGVAREETDRLHTVQAQLEEQVDAMRRLAMAYMEETAQAAELAATLRARAHQDGQAAAQAGQAADEAQARAMASQADAAAQLRRWEMQETAARQDLAAAQSHLGACEHALNTAHANLDQAESFLHRAKGGLSQCLDSGYRDQRGVWHEPNCSAHYRSVNTAQAQVADWAAAVSARRRDLAAAEAAVAQAQLRRLLCERCTQTGRRAVSIAGDAVLQANGALDEARRATGLARRGAEHAAAADAAVGRQQVASERLEAVCLDTRRAVDGAAEHEASARRAQDDTAREVLSARSELAGLADLLDAFDRPRQD